MDSFMIDNISVKKSYYIIFINGSIFINMSIELLV